MGKSIFDSRGFNANQLQKWGITMLWKIPVMTVISGIIVFLWSWLVGQITSGVGVWASFWLGLGAIILLILALVMRPGHEIIWDVIINGGLVLLVLYTFGKTFLPYIDQTLSVNWGWFVVAASVIFGDALLVKMLGKSAAA